MCAMAASVGSLPEPILNVDEIFTRVNEKDVLRHKDFIGHWGIQAIQLTDDSHGASGIILRTRDISIIAKTFREGAVRQAEREARVLCDLRRENIPYVPMLYGVSPYIISPVLILNNAGQDLYTCIQQSLLQLGDISRIAIDVLGCIKFLKEKEITHGDIKLENICYNRELGATLIDWEGAILPNNLPGIMRYTLCCLSPELCLGFAYATNADKSQADVWAAATVIFTLATFDMFISVDEVNRSAVLDGIEQRLGVIPEGMIVAAPKRGDIFNRHGFITLASMQYSSAIAAFENGREIGKIHFNPYHEGVYSQLQSLVLDLLQIDPKNRPSAAEALEKYLLTVGPAAADADAYSDEEKTPFVDERHEEARAAANVEDAFNP